MLGPVARTVLSCLGIALLALLGVIIIFSVAENSLPVRDLFGSIGSLR